MDQKYYQTKNLRLAAFLYASGIRMISSSRKGSVIIFEFFNFKEADALVKQYFSDSALVNPRELFARFDDLKDLIFNTKK